MSELIAAEAGKLDDTAPDAPGGLAYDVEYVIDTWLERKLHGLYPAAGGFDDQDPDLMLDWRKLSMHYLRVKAGIVDEVDMPDDAMSLSEFMKGYDGRSEAR